MNQFLSTATTLVNLLALIVSLSMGFYLVTRSPRSRLSWLAALTLWSLALFFAHNSLAVNVPTAQLLPWIRPAIILVMPLWVHLTLLMRHGDGSLKPAPVAVRVTVPVTYALTLAVVAASFGPFTQVPATQNGPLILLSDRVPGPIYPASILLLAVAAPLAMVNLWQIRTRGSQDLLRQQVKPLLAASALAALGGLYLSVGVWLGIDRPTLPGDLAVAAGVVMLGYGIARYNALLEGRTIRRDLPYVALAVIGFTAVYVLIAELLYLYGHVFSFLTLILLIVVALSTLMLYDGLRAALDRVFYREQYGQLRTNLRDLARDAGMSQTFAEQLQAILSALCRELDIRGGMIAVYDSGQFVGKAAVHVEGLKQAFHVSELTASEIVELPRAGVVAPQWATILAPIISGGQQVGALLLTAKDKHQPYGEDELFFL